MTPAIRFCNNPQCRQICVTGGRWLYCPTCHGPLAAYIVRPMAARKEAK